MAYLATVARQSRGGRPHALLLDAGGWARGGRISDHFQGEPMIEIMNTLGYAAAGVGEHDLTWGPEILSRRAGEARFPVVCANLKLPNLRPYVILTAGEINVGITGLTCAADEYLGAALSAVQILRREADVVLVLSHLGPEKDRQLAREVKGIDCILGAHNSSPDPQPGREGGTVLAYSGEKAQALGALSLTLAVDKDQPILEEFTISQQPISQQRKEPAP